MTNNPPENKEEEVNIFKTHTVERERERERELVRNYYQEIKQAKTKSVIDEVIFYQKLIFDLCQIQKKRLGKYYEPNNRNLDYLKDQWFLWQASIHDLRRLAKSIAKVTAEIKSRRSLINLYGRWNNEETFTKELEELFKKVNELFRDGQKFEKDLTSCLLDESKKLARTEIENLVNSLKLEKENERIITIKRDWKRQINKLDRWQNISPTKEKIFIEITEEKFLFWITYSEDPEELFNFLKTLPQQTRWKFYQKQNPDGGLYKEIIDDKLTRKQQVELLFFDEKKVRIIQRAVRNHQKSKDYKFLYEKLKNEISQEKSQSEPTNNYWSWIWGTTVIMLLVVEVFFTFLRRRKKLKVRKSKSKPN